MKIASLGIETPYQHLKNMEPDLNVRWRAPLPLHDCLLNPRYINWINHHLNFGSFLIQHWGATIYLEPGSFELHQLTALLVYVPRELFEKSPACQGFGWISTTELLKSLVGHFLTAHLFPEVFSAISKIGNCIKSAFPAFLRAL